MKKTQKQIYQQKLRQQRKAKGFCPSCGKINDRAPLLLTCSKCAALSSQWVKEKGKAHYKALQQSLKREAFEAYGGIQCNCCGENHVEFLTIDHINGGGNKHRIEVTGSKTGSIYRWLKRNMYPEGFQVLCFNCNSAKGLFGLCPHEIEKE